MSEGVKEGCVGVGWGVYTLCISMIVDPFYLQLSL